MRDAGVGEDVANVQKRVTASNTGDTLAIRYIHEHWAGRAKPHSFFTQPRHHHGKPTMVKKQREKTGEFTVTDVKNWVQLLHHTGKPVLAVKPRRRMSVP